MTNLSKKIEWPGWKAVNIIGRGSFGEVYEIQRDVFGDIEKAALKVISIPKDDVDVEELYYDGYDSESLSMMFDQHLHSIVKEYSTMKKMSGCKNIVSCDDVRYIQHSNGIGWDIYIKMELLTPLGRCFNKEIKNKEIIKIGIDICNALELCQRNNLIHRDIKPQNILRSDFGDYKLGDFGIAKTIEKTTGGTKIGTYDYMAPEIFNNKPYGFKADIYSLGLVLYWLANEKTLPFLSKLPTADMKEQANKKRFSGEPIPAPKHGSDALKQVILKACAFEEKDRFIDAIEMKKALIAVLREENSRREPIPKPVGSEKEPLEPPLSSNPPEPLIPPPSVSNRVKHLIAIVASIAVVIVAAMAGFMITGENNDVSSVVENTTISNQVSNQEATEGDKLSNKENNKDKDKDKDKDNNKISENNNVKVSSIYNPTSENKELSDNKDKNEKESESLSKIEEPSKIKPPITQSEESISTQGTVEDKTEESSTVPTTTTIPTSTRPSTTKPTTTKPTTTKPTTTKEVTTKPSTTSTTNKISGKYTITFMYLNDRNKTITETRSVSAGAPYGKLPQPTKSNSTFAGWVTKEYRYVETENCVFVDSTDIPDKDMELYAKWYLSANIPALQ